MFSKYSDNFSIFAFILSPCSIPLPVLVGPNMNILFFADSKGERSAVPSSGGATFIPIKDVAHKLVVPISPKLVGSIGLAFSGFNI